MPPWASPPGLLGACSLSQGSGGRPLPRSAFPLLGPLRHPLSDAVTMPSLYVPIKDEASPPPRLWLWCLGLRAGRRLFGQEGWSSPHSPGARGGHGWQPGEGHVDRECRLGLETLSGPAEPSGSPATRSCWAEKGSPPARLLQPWCCRPAKSRPAAPSSCRLPSGDPQGLGHRSRHRGLPSPVSSAPTGSGSPAWEGERGSFSIIRPPPFPPFQLQHAPLVSCQRLGGGRGLGLFILF